MIMIMIIIGKHDIAFAESQLGCLSNHVFTLQCNHSYDPFIASSLWLCLKAKLIDLLVCLIMKFSFLVISGQF